MQVKDSMKIVDERWIKKRGGFRVHFQKRVGSEIVTEYCPGEEEKPLESDVVAWRIAWKLAQATGSDDPGIREGEFINIYVVDDTGERMKYYATNQFEVFNPKRGEHDEQVSPQE